MEKRLCLIFILLFCLATLFTLQTDVEKQNLSGKVRIITSTTLDFKNDSSNDLIEILEFDNSGYLLKEEVFFGDELFYRSRYKEGRPIESYAGLVQETTQFEYDENGNEIINVTIDSNGNEVIKTISQYDSGKLIEEKKILNGKLDKITQYIYEDDKLHEKQLLNSLSEISDEFIYTYNENGLLEVERRYKPSTGYITQSKKVYKYDDSGNLIDESYYGENEKLKFYYIYKYDEKGNQIECKEFNSQSNMKNIKTFEYIFDEFGNWILKTTLEIDDVIELVDREIQYYQ